MIEKMFIMVCCLLCSCMQPHTDDWPMFQHDPQHTGYSASKMPEFLHIIEISMYNQEIVNTCPLYGF